MKDLSTLASDLARAVPLSAVAQHIGVNDTNELDEEFLSTIESTRSWYAQHGDPHCCTTRKQVAAVDPTRVCLVGGAAWQSPLLSSGFQNAKVAEVAVIAVSAGAAIDNEIQRLAKEDLTIEMLIASAFAIAACETLRSTEIENLQAQVGAEQTLLPHLSPGYEGWRLEDQSAVLNAVDDTGPIQTLESSALTPQRSTLAVVGITRTEVDAQDFWAKQTSSLSSSTTYEFPIKALEKWRRDRLSLEESGREYEASFRFDGTTCSVLGVPFTLEYSLRLSRGDTKVESLRCAAPDSDTRYQSMCGWTRNPIRFEKQIAEPPAIVGLTLDEALEVVSRGSSAGCLCEAEYRSHKWRIVLETIHHELSERKKDA
ncbi:MAG: hypothetical protein AAF517_05345 [Planctomycetota bacterium]